MVIVLFCFLDSVAWLPATEFLYLGKMRVRVRTRDGYYRKDIMMIKRKKQISGLNARAFWNINPRTRIVEDVRKNIKKARQNNKKLTQLDNH